MLQRCVVLIAIAFAATGSAFAQAPTPAPPTWRAFTPEGVGYSIDMPGEWILKTEDVRARGGTMKITVATVRAGRNAYITIHSRHPEAGVLPAAQVLDGARDGAVSNVKGKLRKEEAILVSDLPGREFIIDAPNGLVAMSRIFLLDNKLVQAMAAGPVMVLAEPDTRRFLDSLKVVDR
jgi:hypothetical protein